eukprot:CAMPEP_0185572690 /NCGR_PEP_ID=MMETSP0434-20130131/4574_1 /TAXON_ID=626734 ORGANISM="Favella taraikaensis, Strain Fe Narragansett Bay" /NCGR_SAMPLE_ID=MMETSP0434 /ASSEMBLY_ACC=CAM_ASM_000379 /LENGTH=66 /DNA_ID=CAMNT_0028188653 /DNA_START=247 /DNA_END=447 /DNA_ORIENTATION=+
MGTTVAQKSPRAASRAELATTTTTTIKEAVFTTTSARDIGVRPLKSRGTSLALSPAVANLTALKAP